MLNDINKVTETSEEVGLEITQLEGKLSTIYGLFFRKTKEEKIEAMQEYQKILKERKEADHDLDVIIDYHIAIANSMRAIKFNKNDQNMHTQRLKSMQEMIKQDNFTFTAPVEGTVETPQKEKKSWWR